MRPTSFTMLFTKDKIMGWANCGTDSKGRPIGYAHKGTCDHPGCTTTIFRGLEAACGGMHGADEFSCDKYFCGHHLSYGGKSKDAVCPECLKAFPADEEA